MKIVIVGSRTYTNSQKIKEVISELKDKYKDNLVLITGGDKLGTDSFVKKNAINFEIDYEEYNPAHTSKNIFSAMPYWYYGKEYSARNLFSRNKLMVKKCNLILVFLDKSNEVEMPKNVLYYAKKFKVPYIILH